MCESTHDALVAGTPPNAEHLATCASCRALMAAAAMRTVAAPIAVPSMSQLRSRSRQRTAGRIGAAVALAAALVLAALPPAPEPDLLAVLDHEELDLPATDTLALLDPFAGEDPLADDDFHDLFPGGL